MLENWGRLVNVSAPREVLPLTHCAVLLSHGGISPRNSLAMDLASSASSGVRPMTSKRE
jgi:hypothetical protein